MPFSRDSELRDLLLEGKIDEFNQRAEEAPPDLENLDLRSLDLRGANLQHANLRDAYLRSADLRSVDMLYADLDGASLRGARLSGTRFPRNISADEISLSFHEGTRIRADRPASPPKKPGEAEE